MKKTLLKYLLFCTLSLSCSIINAQNAIDFDGVDDKIDCGTDTSIAIKGTALTLEAWIYPTAWKTNAYDGNVICKEYNTSNYGYMLRVGDGGKLNFAIGDGTWREITTGKILSLNTWQHIAGTYDGTKMRVYLNGSAVDSLSVAINIAASTTTPLTLGAHSSYTRFYQGTIDEVRVWSLCRSQSQLLNGMNDEICAKTKGLRAYYKFNHGKAGLSNPSVKTATDYSGFKNTGTLSAFSLTGTTSNWIKGKTLKKQSVYAKDTVKKCERYTSPSGKYKWTTSGVYNDTIPTFFNCDSVITTYLTIKKATYNTIKAYACKTYTSPSGNYTWTKSGTYTDYLVNAVQCDSVLTVILRIGGNRDTLDPVVCRSYTSPSRKYTWTKTGKYYDTLVDFRGCDSVILINLYVKPPTYGNLAKKVCKFYKSPSGKYTYTKSGQYTDTIANAEGCDSIITIDVLINTSSYTLKKTVCNSFKSPSGKYTWTKSGIYKDTLVNYAGCDSFLAVNLTVNNATYGSISPIVCKSYTTPGKKRTYTKTGTYYDTLTNKKGCDSFLTINLTVVKLNKSVTLSGTTLTSLQITGTYQWLDCNKQKANVNGATQKTYTPTASGSFAVQIADSGCTDTSSCTQVVVAPSATRTASRESFTVHPNPGSGTFVLSLPSEIKGARVFVRDATGRVVHQAFFATLKTTTLQLSQPDGIYLIEIEAAGYYNSQNVILKKP